MRWNPGRRRFVAAAAALPVAALPLARATASTPAAALTAHETASLGRACFLLFPYPQLGSAPYERVVGAIAADAERSPATAALLAAGVEALDREAGRRWLDLDEDRQVDGLRGAESTPFFAYLLDTTKTRLFNDPAVWAHIGYEGSSLEFGGYIGHGLNDIDWLGDG